MILHFLCEDFVKGAIYLYSSFFESIIKRFFYRLRPIIRLLINMEKMMKIISKLKTSLLSMALLTTTAFGADEFKFLPLFTDNNYDANIEVAAVVGYMDFDRSEIDEDITYGLDLSFDCPVFTLPGNNLLRQQLSLNYYDKSGLKMTSIEMNPYYFVDLSEKLKLGFGPGIGALKADVDGGDDTWMFTVQAGMGLKYYLDNNILVGADFRYQWTAEKDLGGANKEDLDNMKLLLKVGYAF